MKPSPQTATLIDKLPAESDNYRDDPLPDPLPPGIIVTGQTTSPRRHFTTQGPCMAGHHTAS